MGVSEGDELAEADLADNAESAAGDPVEGERQIEDVIEAQDDPASGVTLHLDLGAQPPGQALGLGQGRPHLLRRRRQHDRPGHSHAQLTGCSMAE